VRGHTGGEDKSNEGRGNLGGLFSPQQLHSLFRPAGYLLQGPNSKVGTPCGRDHSDISHKFLQNVLNPAPAGTPFYQQRTGGRGGRVSARGDGCENMGITSTSTGHLLRQVPGGPTPVGKSKKPRHQDQNIQSPLWGGGTNKLELFGPHRGGQTGGTRRGNAFEGKLKGLTGKTRNSGQPGAANSARPLSSRATNFCFPVGGTRVHEKGPAHFPASSGVTNAVVRTRPGKGGGVLPS